MMACSNEISDQISFEKNISSILEELKCPICISPCEKPILTECNHLFCEKCLSRYVENHDDNYPPCPFCKKVLRIPKSGVSSMVTEEHYHKIIWNIRWPHFSLQERFIVCKKELLCSECDLFFKEPKRLECGHVFCLNCLKNHTESTPSKELFINCPRCSYNSMNLPKGLEEINIDPTFLRIQDLLTTINVGDSQSLMRLCGGACNSVKSVCVKCETCQEVYCKDCSKQHSHYMKDCLTFRLVSDQETGISENNSCDTDELSEYVYSSQTEKERNPTVAKPSPITITHTHKLLQRYCKTCDEPVCKHCKQPDHSKHETCDIKELDEVVQSWLQKRRVSLQKQRETLKTQNNAITNNWETFDKKYQSIKSQMISQVEQIIAELQSKLSEFLEEVSESIKALEKHFKNVINEYKYRLSETDKQLEFLKDVSPYNFRGVHTLEQQTVDYLKLQQHFIEEKAQKVEVDLSYDKQLDYLLETVEQFNFGQCHIQQKLYSVHEEICNCNTAQDQTGVLVSEKKYRLSQDIGKQEEKHVTTITVTCNSEAQDNIADGQQNAIRKSNSKGFSVTAKKFLATKEYSVCTEIDGGTYICCILDPMDNVCFTEVVTDVNEIFHLSIDTHCNILIGFISKSKRERMLLLYSCDGKRKEVLCPSCLFDSAFQRENDKIVLCDGNKHHLVEYLS